VVKVAGALVSIYGVYLGSTSAIFAILWGTGSARGT